MIRCLWGFNWTGQMESNDPVHPLFRDVPPAEAKLWRYLSFAKFASLLNSPRLHSTRVDGFDDHFEGAWPKKDLEYWNEILSPFKVPSFTEQMRSFVAASCWIESPHESAAMWRLYAPGDEGIAITTSFGKLNSLVSSAGSMPANWLAGAGRVLYFDHSNKGLIEKLEKDERLPNTLKPSMLKNISYEHEKEVRALIVAPLPANAACGADPKRGIRHAAHGANPERGDRSAVEKPR